MVRNAVIALLVAFGLMLSVSSADAATASYTVKSGDTLWKIASKNKIGLTELIKANPTLKNPDRINVGQKLVIPSNSTADTHEAKVIKLTNAERTKAGLKPYTTNWELSRVARYKSKDMMTNKYFSHTSPTYGSPFQMMKSFGITYKAAGENIAMGQRTPEEVVKSWMNSSGHRANILSKSFKEIGVGYEAKGNYWTQQFIAR